jgi:histidinol-phosphate phosphatase family protein
VTNQSGIARGIFTEAEYEQVHHRMAELLAAEGAHVDATYMCPHHPNYDGVCECRKPGTLLFRRAAHEHALDLTRSTYIGDRWRDVSPGLALGGHGILIADDEVRDEDLAAARAADVPLVPTLGDAVAQLLEPRLSS